MDYWKTHIPPGVQDFLPDDYHNKMILEETIRENFNNWGYYELEPAMLEYFDMYWESEPSIKQEQIIKFCELGNRILALRPDFTMPIARIAATKFKNDILPLRFSYIGNIYRYEELCSGQQRELAQAGVELMGIDGAMADAEVIAIAIEVLKSLGLSDFQIDIGQVEFYKGLIEKYKLSQEQTKKLTKFVDEKNMLALKTFLEKENLPENSKNIFMTLPLLYGNSNILREAEILANNPQSKKAIQNLYDVYEILEDYGLNQYITFDLGMVHSLNYYTGIIFRGMTSKIGYPICSGGRYDNLVSKFGYDIPATGFAVNINKLFILLKNKGYLSPKPCIDVLVVFNEKNRKKGYRYMQKLRKSGKKVEHFLIDSNKVDPYKYAKEKSIKKVIEI